MSNVLDSKKYLASELTKEKLLENGVTLVVGEAAKLVKRMMRGSYYTITNIEEARNFVAKFSVPSDQLVIVEDLSRLTPAGQATFLKFIEDAYCPLLLLASKDNLLDTITSRSKMVFKVPVDTKYSYRVDSLSDFIEYKYKSIDDNTGDDTFVFDTIEESLINCPDYFYICNKYLDGRGTRLVDKYIRLL